MFASHRKWIGALCLLLCAAGFGLPRAAGQSPASKSQIAEESAAIPANLVIKLRERVGQQVTVTGHIERTSRSNSGHHFLNFNASELTIVCFAKDAAKFKEAAPADAFKNKNVSVNGTLELYKGKLQIRLEDPQQIKILTTERRGPTRAVELKQVGKDVWLSPAGLKYAGHDPAGLTRVEHILRHVTDQPDRDGPHGVFDGGEGIAFAVIDEAWQMAQSRKLPANQEGDRSSYLVSMNRRIGFLGGKEGKQRRHPPLQRVFIVFETGTKNIITAFPR
jgi:hypothetical protein